MTEEMRKRLEEAAEKESKCIDCKDKRGLGLCKLYCASYRKFYAGAEYGYKEAIKQAKEWLNKNLAEYVYGYDSLSVILADFETDMNKLWEEKK